MKLTAGTTYWTAANQPPPRYPDFTGRGVEDFRCRLDRSLKPGAGTAPAGGA